MKIIGKKLVSLLLGVCLLFGGTISVSAIDAKAGGTFHISVVHTNDIHGNILADDENQVLGLARVQTFFERQKKKNDLTFLLDAGDYFHGQSFATVDRGAAAAELMGACGYTAMTVGNHDWNYGKDRLKELESLVKEEKFMFAMLAGNVINPLENNTFFKNKTYTVSLEKSYGKIKVAIFGVFDPRLVSATAPENTDGLWFNDMQKYAQEQATRFKEQGYQLVICLTHCIDPVALASSVDNVDLWVAGHDHKQIAQTVTTPNGGKSYVVENTSNLNTIGNVEIECTLDANGNVASLSMEEKTVSYEEGFYIPEHPDMLSRIEELKAEQAPLLEKVVGYSPEDLNGTWEDVRVGETGLARAVTNAYLMETGADVAIENAGGIRASISKGDVRYQDVLNVSPFGNYVVTLHLTGAQLLSMMERSLEIMRQNQSANLSGDYDAWPQNSGNMLQIAGMQITYDMEKPNGSRILSATVGGQKLVADKEYTVAMNNYLATDTSDYPELTGKSIVCEYGACVDILADYFQLESDEILQDIKTENLVAFRSESEEDNGVPEPVTPVTPPMVVPENPTQLPVQNSTQIISANTQVQSENVTLQKSPEIPNTGFDFDASVPISFACALSVFSLLLKRKSRPKAIKK